MVRAWPSEGRRSPSHVPVMAGLGPAIHVFLHRQQDVDARHKAGHDAEGASSAFTPNLDALSNSQFSNSQVFQNSHASSPVFFGEAPGRPVFPLSPLKDEGDGAPRGATIVLCVPAFPLGNTGRRSARHPTSLRSPGLFAASSFLRRAALFVAVRNVTASVSQLLAGGSYWPPGGAPAPPGCVLCEARPRAPHPAPPSDASR